MCCKRIQLELSSLPVRVFHGNATSLAVALLLAELQYMWAFNLHELFECADLKYRKLGNMVTP